MRKLTCTALLFGAASALGTESASVRYAQFLVEKEQYLSALSVLDQTEKDTDDARMLRAHSLYNLNRLNDALPIYKTILESVKDNEQKKTITLRIFDIYSAQKDVKAAIATYEAYERQFKNPVAKMRYSLGKLLFDTGYHNKASNILNGIPKDNEFYIRARYLMAVVALDSRPIKRSLSLFSAIEKSEPISVEDHAVRSMAILAQARLYVDAGREDIAAKVYQRVPLLGPLGERATIELLKILSMRAEMAANKEGKFSKVSEQVRARHEKNAVADALQAITRYRLANTIDWKTPELLGLTAWFYAKSYRFDEARKVYASLIEHYRPLYDRMVVGEGPSWGFLALDGGLNDAPLVAEELIKNIPELAQALELKRAIKACEETLLRMEDLHDGAMAQAIDHARQQQKEIMAVYDELRPLVEQKINLMVASRINQALAEAEYRRAEVAQLEMNVLMKQRAHNQSFQTEKNAQFERDLTQLDEGGSL